MAREELVKNPHSKTTNTRIGSGQCGYLHFTRGSLGWREISGRLGGCGVLPQKPSCRHVDEPKRPRTKQVGLATKMNNGHSTENSGEPTGHLNFGLRVKPEILRLKRSELQPNAGGELRKLRYADCVIAHVGWRVKLHLGSWATAI